MMPTKGLLPLQPYEKESYPPWQLSFFMNYLWHKIHSFKQTTHDD